MIGYALKAIFATIGNIERNVDNLVGEEIPASGDTITINVKRLGIKVYGKLWT